jgi:DNA (cytosine-5)-methyltransferase 1
MMENVPQVCSDKNKASFQKWLDILKDLGYSSYYKILSATDFGVPQTRRRCFVVSILGDYSYIFPSGWKLDKCLKDVLEEEVDEKNYLSDEKMKIVTLFGKSDDE